MSKHGPLKQGTVRDDGCVFQSYGSDGREIWRSAQSYRRYRLCVSVGNARRRAKDKALPFDLDADYLASIFPSDGKCPALGIPLVWGDEHGKTNSPSLDRIVPERGYVRGNVIYVSHLANLIKSCASADQIGAVYKFYKDLQ